MKNILKLIGIIAFVAVIGFLTGCPASDGGSTPSGGKTLTGIAVTTQPTKTVYTIGEQLSTAGMVVTATYSDGTTAAVTTYTTSGFASSTAGEKTVTVTYGGKTATFTVTVQDPSVGNNQVGGKTYYPYYYEKIVFSTDGSYTGYSARSGDDGYDLDPDGKYQWDISATGTYTWNENTHTVTLKLERMYQDGNPLDKAGYKSAITTMMNDSLAHKMEDEGLTQAELDAFLEQLLAKMGYSSLTQMIDANVNEMFANHPYTYSFKNGSLLMQKALPQPKGTDQLAGKTYNGVTWDDDDHRVKDPNEEYVFGANKTYTHTEIYYETVYTETGSYSYDSTRKQVYLGIEKVDGKTAAEYYDTVTIWGDNRLVDDDAYRAAETNNRFGYNSQDYDPVQKLIGWVD